MKLKKIISLTLVFAMMLTMFAALTVSAAATATLNYVVYDSEGKAVTGNLEADKVYQIAVEYSDVDTALFNSAVITAYDSDVLQLVNKSGVAVSETNLAAAVTTTLDVYDENEGTGTFSRGPAVLGEDEFEISYGVHYLKTEIENVDLGNKFELFRFRVKALKNGAAKISAKKVFFYTDRNETLADVTVAPNSIRVGEVAYVSATAEEGFASEGLTYVLGTTTLEDVVAALDEKYPTVKVTFVDEEDAASDPVDCKITWAAKEGFDADSAGAYKFVGTVDTTAVNYTGDPVNVETNVVVDTLKVTDITAIDDVELRQNVDAWELPATVEVTVTGGKKEMLPATWSPAAVDNATVGKATYTATITGTEDITVPEDKNTVSFDVTVVAKSTTTAPAADAIDEVAVDSNIDAEEILLPAFVTLADGYIDVDEWTIKTVNGEAAPADYVPAIGDVITYAPVFAEGFTSPEGFVATVTVVVPEGKKNVVFNSKGATLSAKTDAGYELADAIKDAGLAADKVIGKYDDGTEVKGSEIVWDKDTTPAYDNTVPGEYVLKGVWNDVYGNGPSEFSIDITIEQAGATDFYFTLNKNSKKEIKSKVYMTAGTFDDVYVIFKPEDADDEIVEWKSSNTSRAIVEKKDATSARVKARQSVGLVKISAKTKSGIEKSFDVVVEAAVVQGSGYVTGNKGNYSILAQAAEEAEGQNAAQNSVFGDLAGYEWAATQIDTLRLLGIVSGKSATSYAPADSVTRAEYLAMLVRLLNLKANGEAKVFTDVNAGDWFYDTVNVASSLGIAYGYENGAFDPNAVIKRQDMAVFAKRAIEVAGLTPAVGVSSTFEDQADIAAYAIDSVLYMTSVGAINGMGNGTFKPLETANRAQAAVVIYNIYSIKNK